MAHLTHTITLPEKYTERYNRIIQLTEHYTEHFLNTEYWTDNHLHKFRQYRSNTANPPWKYLDQRPTDPFEKHTDKERYLYSRYKRCIYARITQILDAHCDEQHAYAFLKNTLSPQLIHEQQWDTIRDKLLAKDTPFIKWSHVQNVVEMLNTHYRVQGNWPDTYTELIATPNPNGTTPLSPDGRGDIHNLDYHADTGELEVTLNTPDSYNTASYYDWTEHTVTHQVDGRFGQLLENGDLKSPTLRKTTDRGTDGDAEYVLDVPVGVDGIDPGTENDRVLAVDLGVKKQATCIVVEAGDTSNGTDEEHQQVAPPVFIDHDAKQKLFRLKEDAERVNDKLAKLRERDDGESDEFSPLYAEYKRTRRKERRVRKQVQNDVANELVHTALHHDCSEIVFEDLAGLEAEKGGGNTSWSISSWARGDLLGGVKYRAELVGVDVDSVSPWGTSRHCPRCGEKGRTVKAPNDHTEDRAGGHFQCEECGYGCDRDVVGAMNVGRKHLSESRMEDAAPVVYTTAGNSASFPSEAESETDVNDDVDVEENRSTGGRPHLTTLSDFCGDAETESRDRMGGRGVADASLDTVAMLEGCGLRVSGGGRRDRTQNTNEGGGGKEWSSSESHSITASVLAHGAD